MLFSFLFGFLSNRDPVAQLDTCRQAGSNSIMYHVYALKFGKDGRIYVGLTSDVNRRLKEHNSGRVKSTKGYLPWNMIFIQDVADRKEARNLEKKMKKGCGKEFLKSFQSDPVAQLDRATAF